MRDAATVIVYASRSLRRNQRWRWRLVHLNGNVLATSGEGYANKAEAEAQAAKVVSGFYAQ